jgi:putative glutamine amidotransferase
MRPLVLATTTTASADYRTEQVMLGSPYLAAIEQPGATALLVTPAHAPESRARLLDLAHGLVLTGGEDVAPERYGEPAHPALGTVNRARDEMEFSLLRAALERGLPVLAICRGMQLLNVALGGTLWQDLPAQLGGSLVHEQTAPVTARWHRARVAEGSRLLEIAGQPELQINSFHHQGVKEVAPALAASATAEDGLVEAVEGTGEGWVVGVQWHPERGEAELLDDRRDPDRRLFWAFTDACRAYAESAAAPGR